MTITDWSAKIGTYLPPSEWGKKPVFEASAELLFSEFADKPFFDREIRKIGDARTAANWKKVVQAVDQTLQPENTEQWTYSERIRLGIGRQIEFFEKIARLVPMAQEYNKSLPLDLSKDRRAECAMQWIFENHRELDAALQEGLEDGGIQKIDVLLQELEYFPEELLLFRFKEEAWQVLYFIAKHEFCYRPLLQKLEIHPPHPEYWFHQMFSGIAHSGYLGLVKVCLRSEYIQNLLESNPSGIGNSIRLAAAQGHIEVVRAILTAEWFQDSPFRSAMISTWRSIWIPPAFLAAARGHHVDVFRFLLGELDMELDILAGWVYTALEEAENPEIAQVVRENPRWPEIEPLMDGERQEIDLRPRRRLQRTGGEIHQITSSRRVRPRLDISQRRRDDFG